MATITSGPYEYPDTFELHPLYPEYIKLRDQLAAKVHAAGGDMNALSPFERRMIEMHKQGLPYTFVGCEFFGQPIRWARFKAAGAPSETVFYLQNDPNKWPDGVVAAPGSVIEGWVPLVRGVNYPEEPPFTKVGDQLRTLPEPWDVLIQRVLGAEFGGIGH